MRLCNQKLQSRHNVLVRVDHVQRIHVYEHCQAGVVQESRGAFVSQWRPVPLSSYVEALSRAVLLSLLYCER